MLSPTAYSPHASRPSKSSLASQQGYFIISFLIIMLILGACVALAMYMLKQDHVITSKFEGKRWNIPAKVYTQPFSLYQDAPVTEPMLESWLNLLDYRPSKDLQHTGTFLKTNDLKNNTGTTYIINTRQFTYTTNDIEPKQLIKVTLKDNKIAKIQSTQPNSSGVVRLEPILMGGIYPDNNEDRLVLNINEFPQPLIDALIATEDRTFFEHHGVSVRGIGRAIYSNLTGGMRQGGSTITQQLVKNFYLNSDRTFERKANEAIMAVLLELHYSKNDILQTYLNEINLGQNGKQSINGFGLAAQFYYNQPLNELRLDQQALLVGLAKGPSQYNPLRNPQLALERRNVVLNNMLTLGKISQSEYDTAIKYPVDVVKNPIMAQNRFPDFLDIVKRELSQYYKTDELKNEGLRVYSTLDPNIQALANAAVNQSVGILRKKNPKQLENLQAALVTANPQNGELLASVGSVGTFTGFNRAIDAKRSVGSLLKPVIYLTAFERGDYNLASSVDDSPVSINLANGEVWSPANYDHTSHGKVPLMTALANSYNQAAVHVGMDVGVPRVLEQLQRMGIRDNLPNYPATLLGAVSLSPLQMLNVYQVLATGGFKNSIHSIRTVVDSQARVIQGNTPQNEQVNSPAAGYMTNYAMQGIVKQGTAKAAQSLGANLNLAGKTGTTNDYRDAWFAGYSGNFVSVVWIGRDDNQPINLSGGDGALPVWMNFMGRLPLTPVNFNAPSDMEWAWLENGTGLTTNQDCPNALYLPIATQHMPKESSQCAATIYQYQQDALINAQRAKDEAEYRQLQQNHAMGTTTTRNYADTLQTNQIPNSDTANNPTTADPRNNANNPTNNISNNANTNPYRGNPRPTTAPTTSTNPNPNTQAQPLNPQKRSETWLQKTVDKFL